jgi:hypothetical protein
MHILVINFKAEFTPQEYGSSTTEAAPIFAEIDGLKIKHMLFNQKETRRIRASDFPV